MERYLLFYLVILCLALWLADALSRRTSGSIGDRAFRMLPVSIALLTLLFDGGFFVHGISASLLAADVLFLVSVFLQPYADPRARDYGVAVLTSLLSVI